VLPKIVLLGRDEKKFYFVQSALNNDGYQFEFINLENVDNATSQILDACLIILDTLPYPENLFSQFHTLQQNDQISHVPILALVKESPPRLRYRIISMGISDYLTVPFDRLDLQVRVRNMLKMNGAVKQNNGELDLNHHAVHALHSLKSLYQELDKSVFNLGKDRFIDNVLESLRKLSKAHFAMLFTVTDNDHLVLTSVQPGGSIESGCTLNIADVPMLIKAVRLGEPTFLNNISPDNPFVMLLTAFFNIRVKSCIVFPVSGENTTRSVLCLLRSDDEKLSEFHYLFGILSMGRSI